VYNLNSTLKKMLGFKQNDFKSEACTDRQPFDGKWSVSKFGDSDIDLSQMSYEFENKYLQKTGYTISKLGVVT
jgi:hypothetical protein